MRLGARRTESLHWKKHTLLFHCSGALEEHGSSSSGLNKDANFIPSSAVNIRKDTGLVGGQWLGYSVSSLVFVPVTLVLAGIAGSDPFFVCGVLEVQGCHCPLQAERWLGHWHNSQTVVWALLLPWKERALLPLSLMKKNGGEKETKTNILWTAFYLQFPNYLIMTQICTHTHTRAFFKADCCYSLSVQGF